MYTDGWFTVFEGTQAKCEEYFTIFNRATWSDRFASPVRDHMRIVIPAPPAPPPKDIIRYSHQLPHDNFSVRKEE
jgi:hypothetical protein